MRKINISIDGRDGRDEFFVTHDPGERREIWFVRRSAELKEQRAFESIWVILCQHEHHRAEILQWLEQRHALWSSWRAMIEASGRSAFERHFGALIKATPSEPLARVKLFGINIDGRPGLSLAEVRRVAGNMQISQVWHRTFSTEAARATVADLLQQPAIRECWEELAEWAREDPSTLDSLIDRSLGKKAKPKGSGREIRRAAAHA